MPNNIFCNILLCFLLLSSCSGDGSNSSGQVNDIVAPIWIVEPYAKTIAGKYVIVSFIINEPSMVYFLAITNETSNPSSLWIITSNQSQIAIPSITNDLLVPNLAEGTQYHIYLVARDAYLNVQGMPAAIIVKTHRADNSFIDASITNITDNQIFYSKSIIVSGTAIVSNTDIEGVYLSFNEGPYNKVAGITEWTTNILSDSSGIKSIRCFAKSTNERFSSTNTIHITIKTSLADDGFILAKVFNGSEPQYLPQGIEVPFYGMKIENTNLLIAIAPGLVYRFSVTNQIHGPITNWELVDKWSGTMSFLEGINEEQLLTMPDLRIFVISEAIDMAHNQVTNNTNIWGVYATEATRIPGKDIWFVSIPTNVITNNIAAWGNPDAIDGKFLMIDYPGLLLDNDFYVVQGGYAHFNIALTNIFCQ